MKASQYFCKWIVPLKHRKHGSLKIGSLSLRQIHAFPPVYSLLFLFINILSCFNNVVKAFIMIHDFPPYPNHVSGNLVPPRI